MTTRPVLAAVDGSPLSLAAARWAAEEASQRGSTLRLVHVWPQPVGIYLERLQAEGAALLDQARQELVGQFPELEIETALLGSSAVDGLVEAAEGCELAVLGTRGLGGFTGLLVGSVSLAVAGRCPVPVVVLRPEEHGARRGDVVIGVGNEETADEVLEFAFSRAERHGTRVVAVHGWDVPAVWAPPGTIVAPVDSATLERAAQEHLARTVGPWQAKYPQVAVESRVVVGGGAKALVDASEEAELVVIGRRMRRHSAGGHLGFTAHAVVHHAHAPIAVVPHH